MQSFLNSRPETKLDPANPPPPIKIGLLTGGDDKSYALGLTAALVSQDISIDFIGSDAVDDPQLHGTPKIEFLNLRGDQSADASLLTKARRLSAYYWRLVRYAATSKAPIFHILWNNKFEFIDRIVLMLYYRLLEKKIVLTAHNVNAARRDSRDGFLNRFSLGVQYRLSHHIFVHTKRMADELVTEFDVHRQKVSVIPFGINDTCLTANTTTAKAKRQLGLSARHKTLLFFGQIAPYKGLEYLIAAFSQLVEVDDDYRLIIAGKVKRGNEDHWKTMERETNDRGIRGKIIERVEFVPDREVEVFFKAADVVILPYTMIFQSGVPFLAYSFGLPVIASDVGSLGEIIVEGQTGYLCEPRDSNGLAKCIENYFSSPLFSNLEEGREKIRKFAMERFAWSKVGTITGNVYQDLVIR